MKNKFVLIGQLKIMKEFSQNDVQKSYLRSAIVTLEDQTPKNDDITLELAAALEMLSYKLCRREAEVLRDTVEYLESLDCEVQI